MHDHHQKEQKWQTIFAQRHRCINHIRCCIVVQKVGVWFRGRNLVNTCTQIKQFLCLNTLKDISLYDEYNMMNIANTIFKALHLLIV